MGMYRMSHRDSAMYTANMGCQVSMLIVQAARCLIVIKGPVLPNQQSFFPPVSSEYALEGVRGHHIHKAS